MSDPTIRAALEAAAEAHRQDRIDSGIPLEGWRELDRSERAADLAYAAATVAAFLFDLYESASEITVNGAILATADLHSLAAAAVAEAARDA